MIADLLRSVDMPSRVLAFLLTAILAVHAIYGVAGGVAVLCLGGGHHHASGEVEHCESACTHGASWLQPVPAEEPEHGCECTDVELSLIELVTQPRSDCGDEFPDVFPPAPIANDFVAELELVTVCRSLRSPSFDGGIAHRLAVVASVRLTT